MEKHYFKIAFMLFSVMASTFFVDAANRNKRVVSKQSPKGVAGRGKKSITGAKRGPKKGTVGAKPVISKPVNSVAAAPVSIALPDLKPLPFIKVNPAITLQQVKEFILAEEVATQDAIRQKLKVPDSVWNKIINRMSSLKKHVQKTILKTPISKPYRHSKIPQKLIQIIEDIAVKYGINPKSFHIDIPVKLLDDEDDDGFEYAAWIYPPELFIDYSNPSSLRVVQKTPAVLCLPLSFIKEFKADDADISLILHHEMIHLRELNGWCTDFILQQLFEHGYPSHSDNELIEKEIQYNSKVLERNTDLLALLEDKLLLRNVCLIDKKQAHLHRKQSFDTPFHFCTELLIKWRQILVRACNGEPFESLLPSIRLLQKEQLTRLA